MELINTYLSGYIMPLLLMGTGLFLGAKMKFFYIFHPFGVIKELGCCGEGNGVSPMRALSQALAGTLGVGNMTGVATAICSGGPGAVFWMWVSAVLAMSVKYFEVALAQKCKRKGAEGYFGGAMYYINDIFAKRLPRTGRVLGGVFAVLCIFNSLLTGNIVQMNSAAGVFPGIPPLLIGGVCAILTFPVILGRAKRVSGVTAALIPFLSALYIVFSLMIIIPSAKELPSVFGEIFRGAFSLRAAGGGVGGFLFLRAIRFGTTRGIFSNEAGCGTSPTAHAQACAKSPHSQGCFGIFEVFADTVVLCTLTALVILLSDGCKLGYSGIGLTMYAFSSRLGSFAGACIGVSVILFAYATIICQAQYGRVALEYLTKKKSAAVIYVLSVLSATVFGTVISEGAMWQAADFIVSLMTAINVLCLLYAAKNGALSQIRKDPP